MNMFTPDEQSLQLCRERLASMVDDGYIVSAVLSAPDGRLIASAPQQGSIDGRDVARMSQLVLALATDETSPRRNRVVCDLKGRPLVILHAGRLVLTVIAKVDANMGMVAGIAEHAAGELRDTIRFSAAPAAGIGNNFAFDADGFTQKVLADIERQRQN